MSELKPCRECGGEDALRDISTAPHDGTYILILADGHFMQARYDASEAEWINGKFGLGFGGHIKKWMPLPSMEAGDE